MAVVLDEKCDAIGMAYLLGIAHGSNAHGEVSPVVGQT
jgi:hypothetical protein